MIKEFAGTIRFFCLIGALAFGVTVGHAAIPYILPILQPPNNPGHELDVQEAKCEMQADAIYKTADKDDVLLPNYVQRCMTVVGYDFVGMANAICNQNYMDAAKAGQLGEPGDYSMYQDPNCYQNYTDEGAKQ